jgi:hypothetical protein
MIKEINYTGLSSAPSDYDCQDGALASVVNLVNENDSLVPVTVPDKIMDITGELLYVHKNTGFTNYIFKNDKTLSYKNSSSSGDIKTFTGTINSVNGIGNVLVVLCSDGVHYIIYKSDGTSYSYKYLGTTPPELPISFGLRGGLERSDEFTVTWTNQKTSTLTTFTNTDEYSDITTVTEQVLAKVNLFIADHATNVGKFLFPFFVRYAYRMYDGTLIMHSAPILMIPSSGCAPIVPYTGTVVSSGSGINSGTFRVAGHICKLYYQILEDVTALKEWKDLIKSVDIFVSAPIYTYDESGECKAIVAADSDSFSVCDDSALSSTPTSANTNFVKKTILSLYTGTYSETPKAQFKIPEISTENLKDSIVECSNFYLLKSIEMDSLVSDTLTAIEIDESYLKTLTNRESMDDDYDSHDTKIPSLSYVYNQRLNLANFTKKLFGGYDPAAVSPYTNGGTLLYYSCFVYIRQGYKEIIVNENGNGSLPFSDFGHFLFYPNTNAYRMVIVRSDGVYYDLTLTQHTGLNGSYYFDGFNGLSAATAVTVAATTDQTVSLPNKVYTSVVSNPFVFLAKGINTVGVGEILGISSTTQALSQGQFGQFPLYVFTNEGVWAMEIDTDGYYSASQVAARDVINNQDSICQIDGGLVYTTEQGIMVLSGTKSECISDVIDGPKFDITKLPGYDTLLTLQGMTTDNIMPQLTVFLSDCRTVYDYANKRLIVFNASYKCALAFSFKSKTWGTIVSNFSYGVNSYPDAYVVTSDNTLINLSTEKNTSISGVSGLIVTRPLKLGDSNVLKTIYTSIHRGMFSSGKVKTALYGSRDRVNWYLVASSKDHHLYGMAGTSYLYFRFVILCTFSYGDSLSGTSIEFREKQTNNLK